MNKQKKIDLYFGFQSEDKIHKELEETFGELKNTSDNEEYGKHFEFDKYNDKCFLEIKSRRIPHNKYMSLMFGLNKYEKGNKLIEEDKDIRIFPEILIDWLDKLPPTIQVKAGLTDGDSTKNNVGEEDLKRIAKEEGWILEPDNSNIDIPLGNYDE